MVSSTPRPYFTPGKEPVPIVQVAGWAPGPVWKGAKSRPTGIQSPDRPARSQSLYRLSYPAHPKHVEVDEIYILRISCASRWFFFTQLYRDAPSTKHKKKKDFMSSVRRGLLGLFLQICGKRRDQEQIPICDFG